MEDKKAEGLTPNEIIRNRAMKIAELKTTEIMDELCPINERDYRYHKKNNNLEFLMYQAIRLSLEL